MWSLSLQWEDIGLDHNQWSSCSWGVAENSPTFPSSVCNSFRMIKKKPDCITSYLICALITHNEEAQDVFGHDLLHPWFNFKEVLYARVFWWREWHHNLPVLLMTNTRKKRQFQHWPLQNLGLFGTARLRKKCGSTCFWFMFRIINHEVVDESANGAFPVTHSDVSLHFSCFYSVPQVILSGVAIVLVFETWPIAALPLCLHAKLSRAYLIHTPVLTRSIFYTASHKALCIMASGALSTRSGPLQQWTVLRIRAFYET